MKRKYMPKAQNLLERVANIKESELKKLEFELGVDEAGRGPVFGSMIFSALWWPVSYGAQLGQLGFTDSKKLSAEDREELFELIELLKGKLVFYAYEELTPEYISNKMMADRGQLNLNTISHNAAIKLIQQAIAQGFNIKHAYLDTVGPADKYRSIILEHIDGALTSVTVTPKADLHFKVVSAASIVGKVTRDHILKDWKFVEQIEPVGEQGSGYPSDPKTIEWLQKNWDVVFGYPNLIRFSWSTYDNIAADKVKLRFKKRVLGQNYDMMNRRFGLVPPGPGVFD